MAASGRHVWPASLHERTVQWHDEPCDAGVVQSDDVTVDLAATGRRLDRWLEDLPFIVEREQRRLSGRYDVMLGDVPSAAFDAAYAVGIPSVAIANFTWDWIYGELGFGAAASAAASAYRKATLLLEATPSGPMPAFPRRIDVGLIARAPAASRAAARAALGLGGNETVVLLAFQPAFCAAVALPRPRQGRVYLAPAGWPADASRCDLRVLRQGGDFEHALACADVVVGKPGYGLIGDVEAAGARFLYVPRPGFPENAVLERHLAARDGTASLDATVLSAGAWEDALADVGARARPAAAEGGGAERAARAIAGMLAVDSGEGAE